MGERPDRHEHWQAGVKELASRRASYPPERLAYYDRIGRECLAILQPTGHVLDVGAGDGSMRERLDCTSYLGIDPAPAGPGVVELRAEDIGIIEARLFDTVLLYSVLQHVEDPARALAGAYGALKPGGRLAMQVCVNDPNPLFMWHWQPAEVLALVEAAGFAVEEMAVLEGRLLCVRAAKR